MNDRDKEIREAARLSMRANRLPRLIELRAPRMVLIKEVTLIMSCFAPRWMADVWALFAK